jgi:ribosome biogenesis GTPase
MSPIDHHLTAWGWDAARAQAFAPHAAEGRSPGRVLTATFGAYVVGSADGERLTTVVPSLLRAATDARDLPAVGDWVALEAVSDDGSGLGPRIAAILERRTAFVRHAPGEGLDVQVLAANVDTVFIVMALTRDFNLRRLERYLGAAWSSGALPVVVLNKADLCPDLEAARRRVETVAIGVSVRIVSAVDGIGLADLLPHLAAGRTVALLGSSGVGKSTLVNALLGEERQLVHSTREDDERGRHTTTSRELLQLPGGAIVLDTPGLRSLALWDDEGIERAFADIEALAAACRFNDCTHDREPGCAVRSAIEAGELPGARLESRRKLERELHALERRTTSASRAAARRSGRLTRDASAAAVARKGASLEAWDD